MRRWLPYFSAVTALTTLCLLVVGALVTSTDSGDAVTTWPLSPEGVMPSLTGGVLYEYGHRMVASLVGLLITIQMVLLLRCEQRTWVRRLGVVAFVAVFAQGLLGGLRVLVVSHDQLRGSAVSLTGANVQTLRMAIAIIHACLAQMVFCITVCIAFAVGRQDVTRSGSENTRAEPLPSFQPSILPVLAVGVTFVQLLLGAMMRHAGAGLAIPDFPTSFGRVLPPLSNLPYDPHAPLPMTYEEVRARVMLHFSHRVGAVVVALLLGVLAVRVIEQHRESRSAVTLAKAMLALLFTQLALGAFVIWTQKAEWITAAHVATGASLLATTLLLAVQLRLASRRAVKVEPASVVPARGRVGDYVALTKPRITFLVVITTFIGFVLASKGSLDWALLFSTLFGAVLVVSATNGLNQVMERDADAKMKRTANRPLPAGRLRVNEATSALVVMAVVGSVFLAVAVNLLTSLLAVSALAIYLGVYTPLKQRTTLCTAIGAIAGAIPPMMGWTAVRNELGVEAWSLFAILFIWQFPHFLAIAWIYREDYANAGFKMLPVIDADGQFTARQIVLYSIALIPVSLLPSYLRLAGASYFVGALILSTGLLWVGMGTLRDHTKLHAKRLLRASVLYLPALLLWLTLDRTPIG